MSIPDTVEADVVCLYSNIGQEWVASLCIIGRQEIAFGKGPTRASALRELADVIE